MKGLELSKEFFFEYGLPMIKNEFPDYENRIAAGLVGHGSECFGYDDEVSLDHDFEPGFCLWIDDEDERIFGFKLMRAYLKLPREYKGVKIKNRSLLGNDGKGVHIISEFYSGYTGFPGPPEGDHAWMNIPSHYLAEATNGEVFYDPLGKFTKIREQILNGMPEDVRLKKLSARVIMMAQTGQYNYSRCIKHGENAAAMLALSKFCEEALGTIFLLNRVHAPYYKWIFRSARELARMAETVSLIEKLICCDETRNRESIIENICSNVVDELCRQGLSGRHGDYLEKYAFEISGKIKNPDLRNMHIMEG